MEKIDVNFEHSYWQLGEAFYQSIAPASVAAPRLVLFNHPLANRLGLELGEYPPELLAAYFSGKQLFASAQPLAMAYAGHQFGHFVRQLGDGRAHLLGEIRAPDGMLFDLQLKGSGQTRFSRRGDGRAALAPMLREYIISEAMAALAIPTTRSLAVVASGEQVWRDTALPGAVLARIASSHLRVGSFQFFAARGEWDNVRKLADYAINRHYPGITADENRYANFLHAIMQRQIALVVNWLRVGFIHGVMNTDNCSISGETIDYGPCAFIDHYDPAMVFSSIDAHGRYAFANQPSILLWNLCRLAECLVPLLGDDEEAGLAVANRIMGEFDALFQHHYRAMLGEKIGLGQDDWPLAQEYLNLLQQFRIDYTLGFYGLSAASSGEAEEWKNLFPPLAPIADWRARWQQRIEQQDKDMVIHRLQHANPCYIPRNHQVEEALSAASDGNMQPTQQLLERLQNPYQLNPTDNPYEMLPAPSDRVYQTFCGT